MVVSRGLLASAYAEKSTEQWFSPLLQWIPHARAIRKLDSTVLKRPSRLAPCIRGRPGPCTKRRSLLLLVGRLATAKVITTMAASASDRRSASQIIAAILQDASKEDGKKKQSSSKGISLRSTRSRLGIGTITSLANEIQDSRAPSTAATIKPTRRASHNDVPSIHLSSTTASRRLSDTGRSSFTSDTYEPSKEELETFRVAAGKYSDSASKSTGRRTSYGSDLANSWKPVVKASSSRSRSTRRASYNDSLPNGGCGGICTTRSPKLSDEEQQTILAAADKYSDGVSRSIGGRLSLHRPQRRTSYEEDLANSWKPLVKADRSRTTRRASYNDALCACDEDDEYNASSAICMAARHTAYNLSEIEQESVCADAQIFARAARSSRRRTSCDDALVSSFKRFDKASSFRSRATRRASYNDALCDSDDDYDDDVRYGDSLNTRTVRPRRRVSFTSNVVESVHEIPAKSKQEKHEMFYRKKDIKQFRMDRQLEKARESIGNRGQ